jgi:hypothetical protein
MASSTVTASDWVKGISLSVLASIIGGASKLAIRKSWLLEQEHYRLDLHGTSISEQEDDEDILDRRQSHEDEEQQQDGIFLEGTPSLFASSLSQEGGEVEGADDRDNHREVVDEVLVEMSQQSLDEFDKSTPPPRDRPSRSSSGPLRQRLSLSVSRDNSLEAEQDPHPITASVMWSSSSLSTPAAAAARAADSPRSPSPIQIHLGATTTASVASSSGSRRRPSRLALRASAVASAAARGCRQSTAWVYVLRGFGMVGMTFLNPLCGVLAMNFASPSILAPFSGLTLVWIILFSDALIGEKPTSTQVLAALMIVLGEVVVALYGDHTNDDEISVQDVVRVRLFVPRRGWNR